MGVSLGSGKGRQGIVGTNKKTRTDLDGKYSFKSQPVTEAELVDKLREAKAGGAELNLVISADTAAQHGNVVHVIDLAKREGITKFAINVDRE